MVKKFLLDKIVASKIIIKGFKSSTVPSCNPCASDCFKEDSSFLPSAIASPVKNTLLNFESTAELQQFTCGKHDEN